jgi:hypothetical protein
MTATAIIVSAGRDGYGRELTDTARLCGVSSMGEATFARDSDGFLGLAGPAQLALRRRHARARAHGRPRPLALAWLATVAR